MVEQESTGISMVGDAKLVSLAQAGDDRAFTMLVALYEPMLRAQVSHFRFPSSDAEDMEQEGLLGLLSAVRSFRPERGASFKTYAAVCVRDRLLSVVRRRVTHVPEVPVEDVATVADAVCQQADPAALLLERESAGQMLAQIRRCLSEREYAVLICYLDGCSYATIASQLHISQKAVDNALQRARHKLQELF